ncbi:hypothetical protein QYF36_019723 [Acer negundo]|nr:hypothetical protein QYF36_019723 [Acer negundo]
MFSRLDVVTPSKESGFLCLFGFLKLHWVNLVEGNVLTRGSLGFAAEVKHNKPAKTVLVDQSREGSSSRRPHISDEDQFAAFSSDFYLFEDVGSSREL